MHSNDARHEPSLVQNGFFTQGLSHWFGSFLRHRWVPTESGDAAAKYHAEIYPERLSAYPVGIRAGINQFLDLPELYTYPARRVASLMRLRGLGNSRFLLDAAPINPVTGESPTLLNGRPLVEGDLNLPGKSALFQHPFLYQDGSRTVVIGSGEQLQVVPFNQDIGIQAPLGFRAGPLIVDKSVTTDQEFAAHVLTASADGDLDAQLSSERDFPGVTVRVSNPIILGQGSIGQGNMTFEGNGVQSMETFPRTDGRGEGIKLGDTISFSNGVTLLANSDGVTIDDGRYQVQYKNLDGATGVSDGGAFLSNDWAVYPEVTVDVTYGMPLYQYDFTLAYSYRGVAPDASRLEFLGLGTSGTISGMGTVVETISAKTSDRVDFADPNEAWTRRFEHIVDEFVEPVAGRAYLNIPPAPPVFSPTGTGFPINLVQIVSLAEQGQATTEYGVQFWSSTGVPAGPGLRITGVDADYDVPDPADPVLIPRKYVISTENADPATDLSNAQEIYLTGYLHTLIPTDYPAGSWVRQVLGLRGPFTVVEYRTNEIVIELTELQDSLVDFNGSGLAVTADETILRVADSLVGHAPYIQVGDLVNVDGDFEGLAGVSQFDPLLELDGLQVLDVIHTTAPTTGFSPTLQVSIVTERPDTITGTSGVDAITNGDPNSPGPGALQQLVAASASVRVGNVSLWRGYRYHRLANTDTADTFSTILGADLSIDPLNKTALAEDTVVPKGAVVLYAGGGACPVGYTPLRGEVESNMLGLANIQTLPLPLLADNIVYDDVTDTTTLNYPGQAFDQLDEQGEPILIPNTAAVVTSPLVGLTTADGEPIYRQVRLQRFRQLIEPGMSLRVPATSYAEGSSPLVSATDNDITPLDVVGPTANADRGHLVVDVQPILRNEGQTVSGSATARRAGSHPNSIFITGPATLQNRYGGGFGSVQYPAVNPAYLDNTEVDAGSQHPEIYPAGPPASQQTVTFPEVFAGADTPWTGQRVGMLRTNSLRTDGFRIQCSNYFDESANTAGYNQVIDIAELGSITLNSTNNAIYALESYAFEGQNQRLQGRDVMYARWYRYNSSDNTFTLRDNFIAIVQRPSGNINAGWNVYRYDRRVFRDVFNGNAPFNNGDTVGTSFLLLHPVKLYGAPGVTQILGKAPIPPGGADQPIGVADGLTQSRLSLEPDKVSWVTENPQAGIKITVAGKLGIPAGVEELPVTPAGYLRYGDEDTLLDYGAGGHTHRIMPNTDLSLANPIPRLHRSFQGEYTPVRLPVEHGHGAFEKLRYPLPAAELFGLCIKL